MPASVASAAAARTKRWGDTVVFRRVEQPEHEKPPWWCCAPATVRHLVGNAAASTAMAHWFQTSQPGCALIVHSPYSGVGKTCMVKAHAADAGVVLECTDSSDLRTGTALEDAAKRAMTTHSKVLFVDDAHSLESTGLASLLRVCKLDRQLRVICSLDTTSDPRLRPVLTLPDAVILQLSRVSDTQAVVCLQRVAKQHGMTLKYFDALLMAQRCCGDLRQCMIALEMAHGTALRQCTKSIKCSTSSMDSTRVLPPLHTAVAMTVRGELTDQQRRDVREAALCTQFETLFLNKVHETWLLHRREDSDLDPADALSTASLLVGAVDCDAEEQEEGHGWSGSAAGLVLQSLVQGQQTEARVHRRISRKNFSFKREQQAKTLIPIVETRTCWHL